ncbi:MAG: hypothetical protein ABW321_15980 [Polyangiales bacterium]
MLSATCANDASRGQAKSNAPLGKLIGEIRLAAGARIPAYTSLDLVRRPLHQNALVAVPAECDGANREALRPVQPTAQGLLPNVVVAASDFTRTHAWKPRKHKALIEHCRLTPSIIAATGGDTLAVENRDAYGFEPLVGPSYQARALTPGQTLEVPMMPGGIDALQCSLGAPCGRTDLLVFFHPVHAVTDHLGHFEIAEFPAAELVRVSAWHPLFEPSETFVWVEPGQVSTLNLELRPRARFLPQAPDEPAAAVAPH